LLAQRARMTPPVRGTATTLVVVQPESPALHLFLEDTILLDEVLDNFGLVGLTQPAKAWSSARRGWTATRAAFYRSRSARCAPLHGLHATARMSL
jgi:hypothetical protein